MAPLAPGIRAGAVARVGRGAPSAFATAASWPWKARLSVLRRRIWLSIAPIAAGVVVAAG